MDERSEVEYRMWCNENGLDPEDVQSMVDYEDDWCFEDDEYDEWEAHQEWSRR
jgi:hypothetical protein